MPGSYGLDGLARREVGRQPADGARGRLGNSACVCSAMHDCEMTAQTVTKPYDGRVVGPYENVKLIPKWSCFVTLHQSGEVHDTLAPANLVASGMVPAAEHNSQIAKHITF